MLSLAGTAWEPRPEPGRHDLAVRVSDETSGLAVVVRGSATVRIVAIIAAVLRVWGRYAPVARTALPAFSGEEALLVRMP